MYHMKHPRKLARKIGEAVFRGKDGIYSFKMYPLGGEVTDAPAVYIISRRTVDRFRRGHHHAVCVGESDAVFTELKRHKRAKCVKENAADTVSIYREDDAKKRARLVDDLGAGRLFSFECRKTRARRKICEAKSRAGQTGPGKIGRKARSKGRENRS